MELLKWNTDSGEFAAEVIEFEDLCLLYALLNSVGEVAGNSC